MKPAWHSEAQRLAAQGLTKAAIARTVGRSHSAVSKALNPERTKEQNRRDNARRAAQKQAWERTEKGRAMRASVNARHRHLCVDCGAEQGPGSKWRDVERCRPCEDKRKQERHAALLVEIQRMWNEEGMTGPEIARALGRVHPNSADLDIQELRRKGLLTSRRRVGVAA